MIHVLLTFDAKLASIRRRLRKHHIGGESEFDDDITDENGENEDIDTDKC